MDFELSRRYPDTWKAMERLVDLGKARAIGNRPVVSAGGRGTGRLTVVKPSRHLQLQRPQDETTPRDGQNRARREPGRAPPVCNPTKFPSAQQKLPLPLFPGIGRAQLADDSSPLDTCRSMSWLRSQPSTASC